MTRGVTTGRHGGAQFPGRRIIMGMANHCGRLKCLSVAPKSPNNFASTFFNTVNVLPKSLRFEHGGNKLATCPGCRLASLRP